LHNLTGNLIAGGPGLGEGLEGVRGFEGYATAQLPMTSAARQELSTLRWRIMRAWFLLPIPLALIALGAASLIQGRTTIWQAPLWGSGWYSS
jgi:heme O synthase-like polyprenyltransferase